jgi:hypothetical protein
MLLWGLPNTIVRDLPHQLWLYPIEVRGLGPVLKTLRFHNLRKMDKFCSNLVPLLLSVKNTLAYYGIRNIWPLDKPLGQALQRMDTHLYYIFKNVCQCVAVQIVKLC